jgi:predicted dehydrogenase
MNTQKAPVKLCIVGCGVQTEKAYLPTLSKLSEYKVESLVDIDLARCRTLADRFKIPHYARSLDDIPATVQSAVVALPHYLHSPVAWDLKNVRKFQTEGK